MGVLDRLRGTAVVPVTEATPSAVQRTVQVTRSFFAAATSRLFGAWSTSLVSADRDVAESLAHLRSRHRDLVDNNPLAAAAVRVFVENIAGPDGMLCTPMVTTRSGDLRARVNRQLVEAFAAWGELGTCTVDGGLSWVDVQRLAVRTWQTDGEVFIRLHRRRDVNPFGFALQLIDPDLIDHSYTQRRSGATNEIRMGVELDRFGRPVAYHAYEEHPSHGGGRRRVRIPATEMLHLYTRRRPDQTRGVPMGVAAMARLKMRNQYDEFELGAAQLGAGMGVLFKQAPDGPQLLDPEGKPLPADVPMRLEAMMGQLLPQGVEPFVLSAEHPTSAYEAFTRATDRQIAAGYGLAYSTLTGDLTQSSYGSMRDGALKERDLFRGFQRWFASAFCVPVYRAWLEQALLTRAVTLPSERAEEWWAVQFSGRGWPWIDPEKDIRAVERHIALGLASRQQVAREMGRSYEDVLRETSEDLQKAAEWGVPVAGLEQTKASNPTPVTPTTEVNDDGTDDA